MKNAKRTVKPVKMFIDINKVISGLSMSPTVRMNDGQKKKREERRTYIRAKRVYKYTN